ncbi:glycosyltransferase [uncultured Cytophaga sp.]|uniref:glycosyltransferase family 2 protein n=1 Tax=uncultured Cytophaga sp. TaxID=160238 RepID=UPI002633D495|nr:glycosyltransferase [uncultured Cytophaga sp.]
MDHAPIILFVYNRPHHTQKTIDALKKNTFAQESELFIFSDGAKSAHTTILVEQVRSIIHSISGFKNVTIFEQKNNQGLAKSVIEGVTKILNRYKKVIVIEDDIVTTPNFLHFMNVALETYSTNKNIFSVTGYALPIEIPENYTLPVYLSYRGSSWGWAIWKDRWDSIDWEIKDKVNFLSHPDQQRAFNKGGGDLSSMLKRQFKGEIDSWAIRFAYNAFKKNTLHITPIHSKVQNIGHDNSGVHSNKTTHYEVQLTQDQKITDLPTSIPFSQEINNSIYTIFKKPLYKKIIVSIISYLKLLR